MNSEFQIIRWGIPGWIFFMTIIFFKLTVIDFDIVLAIGSFSNPAVVAGIAAFFVALGVPLGYVLFQIYYAAKWKTINPKVVRLACDGITELKSLTRGKKGLKLWYTIEGYYDRLMTVKSINKKVSYEDLKRRYESFTNRTSRIHGLGASVLGMITGFILFLITTDDISKLLTNNFFIISLVAFGIALIALLINYKKQNKYSFVQLNKIMKDIIEAEEKESSDS